MRYVVSPRAKKMLFPIPSLVSPEKEEENIPLMRFGLRHLKAEFSLFRIYRSLPKNRTTINIPPTQ